MPPLWVGHSLRAWCGTAKVVLWGSIPHTELNFKPYRITDKRLTMPNLSELCATLPTEFVEREEYHARMEKVGLSRKLAWKEERKEHHRQVLAYREREERRASHKEVRKVSIERSRSEVRRETMPTMLRPETEHEIFFYGKGVRPPKKVKNHASSEEMGTIRPRIVVKRFAGSRVTCVCKSRIF